LIALPASLLFRLVGEQADEIREKTRIAPAPEQNAIGGKPIPTGTASFLVILLDRFRQSEMDHSADGSLVDAETESNRADEDADFVRHPSLLILATGVGFHLAVIRESRDLVPFQKFNRGSYLGDGWSVDDHVLAGIVAQGGQQHFLLQLFVAFDCEISQIRAVEAGDVFVRLAKAKLLDNVVAHATRGARRECGNAALGKFGTQAA